MKILSSIFLVFVLVAFGCKTSEKSTEQFYKVESAQWHNWAGGVAGVGGTNYEILITVPKGKKVEATKVIIDEEDVKIDKTVLDNDTLRIICITNTSNRNDVMHPQMLSPKMRTEDPKSASLSLSVDGKELTIPIENFEKAPSKNYQ